jgi:hypothetical protein
MQYSVEMRDSTTLASECSGSEVETEDRRK